MKTNDKIALLLRHADRDDIPEGSFGNEIVLNDKGKRRAELFGESFAEMKINRIYTSPVERCVQTAEFITKGYGKSIEVIETKALGAPGLHITDEKIAGNFYLEHGFDKMYSMFKLGNEIPGMASINELNFKLTSFIKEHTKENGRTLFITHDMLIAFYHFSINGKVYTKENWVNYLTGLTFTNGIIDER